MNRPSFHVTTDPDGPVPRVLIYASADSPYLRMLEARLQSYSTEVTRSDELPHSLTYFSYCFLLDPDLSTFKKAIAKHHRKIIAIFLNLPARAEDCHKLLKTYRGDSIKIISLQTSVDHFAADLEKILWFSFTGGSGVFLPIEHLVPRRQTQVRHHKQKHPARRQSERKLTLRRLAHPKNAVIALLAAALIAHLAFIPFLGIATTLNYQAARAAQNGDFSAAHRYANAARPALSAGSLLYSIARPTYSLFSLAILPDDAFLLNRTVLDLIEKSTLLRQLVIKLQDLIMDTGKTASEAEYTGQVADSLFSTLQETYNSLMILEAKLPNTTDFTDIKKRINTATAMYRALQPFFPHLGWLMGQSGERTYLILFANNMELRPGGGFIGSFAVVKTRGFSLVDLQVYDVYDADGQLKAHVRPPAPIREHLDQPHWFLRDSAFSPDFIENASQAKFFLDKSMGMRSFDGVMLITTTAIQNMLEAMDSVYVPDFKERITPDNFYIKAQMYAEKNFFPGSRQKKSFLAALMRQMIQEIAAAPPEKLFAAVKRSLDEKQIVVAFSNKDIQSVLDSNYWSGRTIMPTCTVARDKNCVVDYLFPYDANLGVNKANFFVTKRHNLEITISPRGEIHHKLTIHYKNASEPNIFPGGTYKNYFQVLLPAGVRVQSVVNMGKKLDTYDINAGPTTRVGFLTQVPPRGSGAIVIDYSLDKKISRGNGVYQLVLQKQIGSQNADFGFAIKIPKNLYVVNKNFSPIVKDNKIIYNTSLSADKIFFLEFFLE